MPTAEMNIAVRASAYETGFVGSEVSGANILASTASNREALAARWTAIIDHSLIPCGQSRHHFEVDGLIGPSSTAISKAFNLVRYMRDREWPLPTGIVADGEGGIVFENRHEPIYQRIEIDEKGEMRLVTFRDCKLMRQEFIDVE